jgi:hypothetical protein
MSAEGITLAIGEDLGSWGMAVQALSVLQDLTAVLYVKWSSQVATLDRCRSDSLRLHGFLLFFFKAPHVVFLGFPCFFGLSLERRSKIPPQNIE